MSLYDGEKTSQGDLYVVSGVCGYSGDAPRSVLSHFLFAVVIDVVTEFAREGELSELLYADDLVLISETIDQLLNKFL